MRTLVAAGQSAATSSNLQLYTIISVQDPERRDHMAKLCGDQQQIRDASWFLCFLVDHYRLREAAKQVGEEAAGLPYAEYYTMAVVDASLAAERMVCAAEAQGIGICYIGGLRNDPEGVRDYLKLPAGTFGLFGLCLGYPADDSTAAIKPRLGQDAIWHREQYDLEVDIEEYNSRMKEFYESEKMRGDVKWSQRSARRVDLNHFTGREKQLDFLHEAGVLLH